MAWFTPRRRQATFLGKKVGRYATLKPPVRKPRVVLQAAIRQQLQRTRARLGKVVRGAVVAAARFPKRIRVIKASKLAQIRTKSKLSKPLRAVRKPRRIRVTLAKKALQPQVRSRLGKVIRGAVVAAARFPKRIRVALAKRLASPRVKAKFIEAFGHATRRPPIRKPLVLLQTARKPPKTLALLRKVVRGAAAVAAGIFPEKPRVVLARRLATARVKARLTEVFGHTTRRPPVRRPRVLLQAVSERASRAKEKTRARFIEVFGHATGKPPVRRIQVLTFASEERAKRRYITGSAEVKKVFGHKTTKPPVRRIRTALFASNTAAQRVRISGSAYLGKVVRTFTPAAIPNLGRIFIELDTGHLYIRVGAGKLIERLT